MKVGAKAVVITGPEGGHGFATGSTVEYVGRNEYGGYVFKGTEIHESWSHTPDEPVHQWLDENDFKLVVDSE